MEKSKTETVLSKQLLSSFQAENLSYRKQLETELNLVAEQLLS